MNIKKEYKMLRVLFINVNFTSGQNCSKKTKWYDTKYTNVFSTGHFIIVIKTSLKL